MQIMEEQKDNVFIFKISGRLDSNTSPEFEEKVTGAIEDGSYQMIIDLENLEYLSSAGLRVLLKTTKMLKNEDGRLVLCSLADYVREVFEISGFDTFLPIVGNFDEVLGVFRVPAHGYTYACVGEDFCVFDHYWFFYALENSTRDVNDLIGAHVFYEHDELVAGKPTDVVARTHMGFYPRRHLLEQGVSGVVSVLVVDTLESIEVYEQERKGVLLIPLGAVDAAVETLLEINAIWKPGQAVVGCQYVELVEHDHAGKNHADPVSQGNDKIYIYIRKARCLGMSR